MFEVTLLQTNFQKRFCDQLLSITVNAVHVNIVLFAYTYSLHSLILSRAQHNKKNGFRVRVRTSNLVPNIRGFKAKINIKYEVEFYIYFEGKDNGWFNKKWHNFGNILKVESYSPTASLFLIVFFS